MSGNIFDCHYWGVAIVTYWEELMVAAKHSTLHRIALTENSYPAQNVSSVTEEQPCKLTIILSSYLHKIEGSVLPG